jgi:hypothetical protein
MSVYRGRRSSPNSLILPLALAATAAAASAALWYFLNDNDDEDYTSTHEDYQEERRSSRRDRGQSHDRITELDEESSDDRIRSSKQPRPTITTYDSSRKRSIAIVVSELHRPETNLLHQLPTPLNLERHTIFVLVYSPMIPAHPLAAEESRGTVYNQARSLFPTDYPAEFVLPFSEQPSLVPLLKQLEPETVYIEEDLIGEEGELVAQVMQGGWVGNVVVTLEDEQRAGRLDDVRTRFGKKCKVLSMGDVGEDWMQRVE